MTKTSVTIKIFFSCLGSFVELIQTQSALTRPTTARKHTMPNPAMPHPRVASCSSHAAGSSPEGGGLRSWCHTRSRRGGRPGIPHSAAAVAGHMWWWCWPPSKGCLPLSAHIPPASCLESVLSGGPGPPDTQTENNDWNLQKKIQIHHNLIWTLQLFTHKPCFSI